MSTTFTVNQRARYASLYFLDLGVADEQRYCRPILSFVSEVLLIFLFAPVIYFFILSV